MRQSDKEMGRILKGGGFVLSNRENIGRNCKRG